VEVHIGQYFDGADIVLLRKIGKHGECSGIVTFVIRIYRVAQRDR
jgi:hypothetical protein